MGLFETRDEDFEPELGPLVRSWKPLPAKEIPPEAGETSWVLGILTIAAVIDSLAITSWAIRFFDVQQWKVQLFLVGFIGLMAIQFLVMTLIGLKWHAAGRLAVYERGIRLRKVTALFEEIQSIHLQLMPSFAEKNLPTLERVHEIRGRRYGYTERQESRKRNSLTIALINGKRLDWKWIRLRYSSELIDEFIQKIRKLAPDKIDDLESAPTE